MKTGEVMCTFEQGGNCGIQEEDPGSNWALVQAAATLDHTTGTDQGKSTSSNIVSSS